MKKKNKKRVHVTNYNKSKKMESHHQTTHKKEEKVMSENWEK